MTIPIIPGPFSFLQSIGQGAANFAEARKGKRAERQQLRNDAWEKVKWLTEAVHAGKLSPAALNSPLFKEYLGIADPDEAFRKGTAEQPEEAAPAGPPQGAAVPGLQGNIGPEVAPTPAPPGAPIHPTGPMAVASGAPEAMVPGIPPSLQQAGPISSGPPTSRQSAQAPQPLPAAGAQRAAAPPAAAPLSPLARLASEIQVSPEATLAQAQTAEIKKQLPKLGQAGREKLAAEGKLPTSSEELKEEAQARIGRLTVSRIGQLMQPGVMTPQQLEKLTGIPSKETAAADVAGAMSPQQKQTATDVVETLAQMNPGRMPTIEEATTFGAKTKRGQELGLTQEMYGSAIEKLAQERERLRIYDVAAQAKMMTAEAREDYIKARITPAKTLLDNRMKTARDDIDKKREGLSVVEQYRTADDKSPVSEPDQKIFNEIGGLAQQLTADSTSYAALDREEQAIRAGEDPVVLSKKRSSWDAAAEYIKANPEKYGITGTPTDADYKRILGNPRP